MKSNRELASLAISIQDACNLSGVVYAFANVMHELHEQGLDTEAKNTHPVAVMFASKIASLTHCEGPLVFARAYDMCLVAANVNPPPQTCRGCNESRMVNESGLCDDCS